MDISYKTVSNGRPYRFNYRVAAIIEAQGKILLHKFLTANYSFLPGGRVQIGETAQQAIIRELQEELGIDIDVNATGLPFIVENFFTYGDENFHEISFYFTIDGNALVLPRNDDIRDNIHYLWRKATDVADLNLQPAFLHQALTDIPRFIKHIVHIDDTLK